MNFLILNTDDIKDFWLIGVDLRISIDQKNAEEIESLTGRTLTKNGNELVGQIIEMAKKSDWNGSKKSIEVCDFTEKMASNEEETEAKN